MLTPQNRAIGQSRTLFGRSGANSGLRAAFASAPPATQCCLACAREQPSTEFASAHLWPLALGGRDAPVLFQSTALCEACRHLALAQIDAAFLKGWFMQAELARAAHSFLDPHQPGPAPLAYLGTAADILVAKGEVCDRWAGLAGEAIYHVHNAPGQIWTGFGRGGEGLPGAVDGGHATLVLSSPSHYWSSIALQSFAAHFPQAARWCINEHPALKGIEDGLAQPRHGREGLIAHEAGGRAKVINVGLRDDYSQRFLVKLALGIGHGLFGEAFSFLPYSRQLRRAFWQQNPQVRGFAGAGRPFELSGAWTLALVVRDEVLGLSIVSPTGKVLGAVVADDPRLWTLLPQLREGIVHIAIPQRHIFSAALSLTACLAHQSGAASHPELTRLQRLRVSPRQLPSKQGFA